MFLFLNDLLMRPPKLFFFHIPKCAGTTIWQYIRKIHGRRYVLQIRSMDDLASFQKTPSERLQRYTAIGGHHWLSTYQEKLDNIEEYFKITTLRDPIDRIISSYNYIISYRKHHQHKEVLSSSFENFALNEMHNMQARLLTGGEEFSRAVDLLDGWFDYYATSSQIGLLLKKLSDISGTPFKGERHDNVSPKKVTKEMLSSDLLSQLEEMNFVDMKLYQHAQNRVMITNDLSAVG